MKRTILTLLIMLVVIGFTPNSSNSQTVRYTYTKPQWTVAIGPVWNLAVNDAYGRANYANQSEVLRDNYGMRWGWGGFIEGKFSPGKKRNDRIFLGVDYKGMVNSDFEGGETFANSTSFDFITIDAGYEYLFYGTYGFRSYYGGGLTGNFISGTYTPAPSTTSPLNVARNFESSFRVGMELKAGLEFVINSSKKNYGITVGAKYNLTNLFNDDNSTITAGQPLGLNDGKETPGPGFKRYMGIVSIDVGLTLYPDVKKVVRK